ncbi:MAG: formate dehydrogenase accessory sulfurtransferase FdhD, partial [Methylococcales bacterium]|nr:formate dehydrogenase accessory sulfurtransferase FdhD [Methylococcales bacterium]
APTGLAIRLANEAGLTLIGFARDDQHVVYAHPERLIHINSTTSTDLHNENRNTYQNG